MALIELLKKHEPAVLALADGSIFRGVSIGAQGETVGEVVFNTSMTGYQEILTDPSYAEQLVTLTYPHIGNTGVNEYDRESNRVWAAGLIIRELSPIVSNWRATASLSEYLRQNHIVAIAGIDTRRLTRILRSQGAQNGCILAGTDDADAALKKAQAYSGMLGKELAKSVSISAAQEWKEGVFQFEPSNSKSQKSFKVVVYDYGVKYEILRLLVDRGCEVMVVPADTSAEKVLAMKPDGVVLSNGPGDPAASGYAINNIKILLEKNMPIFGICLGFQLLGLACGGKTIKLKFGHHGANHPVQNMQTQHVAITSQNHGFSVDEKTLPKDLIITHRSLFDGTIQGMRHRTKPVMAFQGHPEASPGPHDIQNLFNEWVMLCQNEQTLKVS